MKEKLKQAIRSTFQTRCPGVSQEIPSMRFMCQCDFADSYDEECNPEECEKVQYFLQDLEKEIERQ